MLNNIAKETTPFLLFFFGVIVVFGWCMMALGVFFDETLTKDPFGDFTGFTVWQFPFILYMLR
jgi:hypothetical protein